MQKNKYIVDCRYTTNNEKVYCDGKEHLIYVQTMGAFVLTDKIPCLCAVKAGVERKGKIHITKLSGKG